MSQARGPRNLWVREPYLEEILSRRKMVEVRVGYANILRLQPGDNLLLNGRHPATIVRVGRYVSFGELLEREDPAAIAPDLACEELLAILRDIYSPEKEALGVIALELKIAPGEVAP